MWLQCREPSETSPAALGCAGMDQEGPSCTPNPISDPTTSLVPA